jgi:hypothetical protein
MRGAYGRADALEQDEGADVTLEEFMYGIWFLAKIFSPYVSIYPLYPCK